MFLNKLSDRLVFNFLSKIDYGYLEIKTFDGELIKYGNQEEPLSANIIIKKPEHWLWSHRRWKHKREQ